MSTSKKALGKGLAALLGEEYSDYTGESQGLVLQELPVESLEASQVQPRQHFDYKAIEELAESIQLHGILQPLLARRNERMDGNATYEIIAGERRWRAAKLAGLATVPVIVRELNDSKALEIALLENIQRQDLNPIEEAAAYFRLMEEFQYTQETLAGTVGKSRSHIANLLRLLTLPEHIKKRLEAGELSMGHARAVLNHPHADKIVDQVIGKGLSVRQTETLARQLTEPSKDKNAASPKLPHKSAAGETGEDTDLAVLEEAVGSSLGLPVKITNMGQGGEVSVRYGSLSELDYILRRLGANAI